VMRCGGSPSVGRIIREADEDDIFVRLDGKVIAKRGHPGTPQAGTRISLEPGYTVLNSPTDALSSYNTKASAFSPNKSRFLLWDFAAGIRHCQIAHVSQAGIADGREAGSTPHPIRREGRSGRAAFSVL
jgi:hypothetical protein